MRAWMLLGLLLFTAGAAQPLGVWLEPHRDTLIQVLEPGRPVSVQPPLGPAFPWFGYAFAGVTTPDEGPPVEWLWRLCDTPGWCPFPECPPGCVDVPMQAAWAGSMTGRSGDWRYVGLALRVTGTEPVVVMYDRNPATWDPANGGACPESAYTDFCARRTPWAP